MAPPAQPDQLARRVRRGSKATQATLAPLGQRVRKAHRVILASLAPLDRKAPKGRRVTLARQVRKVHKAFKATLAQQARLAPRDQQVRKATLVQLEQQDHRARKAQQALPDPQAQLVPPAHKARPASAFQLAAARVKCWPRRRPLTTTRHGLTSRVVVVVVQAQTYKSSHPLERQLGPNQQERNPSMWLFLEAVVAAVLEGGAPLVPLPQPLLVVLVGVVEVAQNYGFWHLLWEQLNLLLLVQEEPEAQHKQRTIHPVKTEQEVAHHLLVLLLLEALLKAQAAQQRQAVEAKAVAVLLKALRQTQHITQTAATLALLEAVAAFVQEVVQVAAVSAHRHPRPKLVQQVDLVAL